MKKYIVIKAFDIGLEISVPENTILTLNGDGLYLNDKLICHKNSVIAKRYLKLLRKTK